MNIFELKSDLNFQQVHLLDQDELDYLYDNRYFCGKTIGSLWKPPKVKLYKFCDKAVGDRVKTVIVPPGDYPGFVISTPIFTERALNALRKFLEPNGEILPFLCDEMNLYLFNIHTILDALDVDNSKCRFYSAGGVAAVYKYSFRNNVIDNIPIFKIKQFPATDIYVNQDLVDTVEKHELKGFLFKKIWSSD